MTRRADGWLRSTFPPGIIIVRGGGVTRALTKPLAQTTWDYVEVVFKNGNEYYAGAAVRGKDLYFTLPEGTYQAVMFAGVGKGTRLLAVGVPTAVDGSDAGLDKHGSIKITANTKKITFSLCALSTDIVSGASFMVDGGSTPGGVYALDGKDVPYFLVPVDKGGIKGTFKIGGFTVGAIGVPNDGDLFATPGLFGVLGAASNIIQAIGTTAYDSGAGEIIPPMAVGGEVTGMRIDGGELAIDFELATNVTSNLTEGFSRIWFDVPIQAFTAGSAAAGRGHVWHIVNGLEPVYDLGGDSVGENILLYTGGPYYVSTAGQDAWDGKTPETAFKTLQTAVDTAKGNAYCREIIVLTDLEVAATVTITSGVNENVVTVRSKTGGTKATVTKATGNNGSVITITGSAIAFKDITFVGLTKDKNGATADNDAPLITVTGGGTLFLEDGAKITGNTNTSITGNGGGVSVSNSTFKMSGGTISGNNASRYGGGVYVAGGEFTMSGTATISKNEAFAGGGVYAINATFTMKDTATISGNNASSNGGGVFATASATFTMEGTATISDNKASNGGGVYVNIAKSNTFTMKDTATISKNEASNGGGVYVQSGPFIMNSGTISGNNASSNGGGVYVTTGNNGTFTKEPATGSSTSGVIYGYIENSTLGNWVGTRNTDKTPASHIANSGDAVYYAKTGNYRTDTLNAGVGISTTDLSSPPWDN
jgi:hypothetical protein